MKSASFFYAAAHLQRKLDDVWYKNMEMMTAIESIREHYPEYLIEAAGLGAFMISVAVAATLIWHPESTINHAVSSELVRRLIMGCLMGVTAIVLIYSPWGKQSGAHFNPALALEFVMSGGLILMVLLLNEQKKLAPYTGVFTGLLLLIYITVETPVSGMSINPARTMASALVSGNYSVIWIYFVGPISGMLIGAKVFRFLTGTIVVHCTGMNPHSNHCRVFKYGHDYWHSKETAGTVV